ncbi:putative lipoprotein [Staphylococcus petrasii]|uniref:Putative lipoprotein n=1 Tax=Staphylococcus petrasii TaxID=1276936 RepID=A0A380G204_9STAP|nr:hypothetical protein [Staphylococcus petrasii]PNZ30626.1 hypothetical protein CD137_04705 [Staphylococcus petrasii]TGE12363.1 hypothetical protein E2557_06130 [Staphylococcus petrasii]TGE17980.1 hypothetical protein BJR09_05530 [Staphylococcus petrasii]SUM45189.1 putative lipoprotein [Staphylococcus petrasii]
MKKLFGILLTSTLILGACSAHDDASKKDEDNKSGMKSNDPNKDKSKSNKKDSDKKKSENKSKKEDSKKADSQDKSSNENEQQTSEQSSQQNQPNQELQSQQTQSQQQTQQVNNQQPQNNQQQYSDEYLANHPVSTDGQLTPAEQQRYNEAMKQSKWETDRANQLKQAHPNGYNSNWTEEQQAHAEYETKKSGRPGMADDVTVPSPDIN